MKKTLFCLSVFLGISGVVIGQSSVNTSGGNTSSQTGSVSYVVGQTLYGESEASKFSSIVAIEDIQLSVYPNPTTDYINISVEEITENLRYEFHNVSGQLLLSGDIEENETNISVQELEASQAYFITVFKKDETVQTFQILKN